MRMAAPTWADSGTAAAVVDAASPREPDTSDAPPVSPAAPLRLLRFAAVRERTGLSRSTIWRLERQGFFPRRRRISHRVVAWAAEEVEAWSQLANCGPDAPHGQR